MTNDPSALNRIAKANLADFVSQQVSNMPRTIKTILNRPPKQKPGQMPTGKNGTKPGKGC